MSDHPPSIQGWQTLPAIPDDVLTEARLQLHWAAQVVGAVGDTYREHAPDDSQANLGWVDGMQLLAGRYLETDPSGFASLTPSGLRLAFHEPGGEELETIGLDGRTLDDAYAAMETAIARRTGLDRRALTRRTYDMPVHPVAQGGKFEGASDEALRAIHAWLHDANLVLRDLRAKTEASTLPRVWPHHFDMGMLISLEPDGDPSRGRSIGLGLSPGDDSDPAPYWYVSPYPRLDSVDGLPRPRLGRWTTQGFTGLKLDAATTIGHGSGQEERARDFVDEALAICRDLL